MEVKITNNDSFVDHCPVFKSGVVTQMSIMTDSLLVNDNSVQINLEFKGITKLGVEEPVIYSIEK